MPSNDPHAHLSRRQRQIMDALYRLEQADAKTIQEQIPNAPGYSAVRAMLARLEEAGHITHTEQGARYIYMPILEKNNASVSAIKRLVGTFFAGSPLRAATAFIDNHSDEMSDDELKALEQKIKQARKNKKQL